MKYSNLISLAFGRSPILITIPMMILMHSANASQPFFVKAGAVGGDGGAKSPYGSIQDAVDAAAAEPGADTIKIASGVYEENIEIDDDYSVTLEGQGDVTIKHPEIDLEEDKPEDVIDAKGDGDVTFQNLSIEGLFIGEDRKGRGIDAKNGSFAFINVSVFGTDGDSIRVRDFDELTMMNVDVSSLNADGFDIEDGNAVSIESSSASDCDDEGLEVDRVDSIVVVGGEYSGNGDDGINIDDSTDIRVVNAYSANNEGNGLQTEAESQDVESIEIIGSVFVGNEEHGIHLEDGFLNDDEDEDGRIHFVSLRGNTSNDNEMLGYDIFTLGEVVAHGNKASGNGDNTLP